MQNIFIKNTFEKLGFTKETSIQKNTFDQFYNSKLNILAIAKTGTGKTYAYLLPILDELIKSKTKGIEAVICLPTNELVIQVKQMLQDAYNEPSFKVDYYIGSMDKETTRNDAKIIVTTPDKLRLYMLKIQEINLKNLRYFVLDEADMMFDEDFLEILDEVVSRIRLDVRFLLFSATLKPNMKPFVDRYFGTSKLIDTTKEDKVLINYYSILTKEANKEEYLLNLVKHINPYLAIVFSSSKAITNKIYEVLYKNNYKCCLINGDVDLKKRKQLLIKIRNNEFQYIIASDLMARGIDLYVDLVINYDLPNNLEFFYHRVGRTARMNKDGEVISLVNTHDENKLNRLVNKGIEFQNAKITVKEFKVNHKKEVKTDYELINEIKRIKKPTKISPNYKKKNKEAISKIKKKLKTKRLRNEKAIGKSR